MGSETVERERGRERERDGRETCRERGGERHLRERVERERR